MSSWQQIFDKIDDNLAQLQVEGADDVSVDLRLREGTAMLVFSLVNEFAPSQGSSKVTKIVANDLVNIVMTDYNGSLNNDQFLSNMDKEFFPQPAMLAHWADKQGFTQITPTDKAIKPQDAADKYILTYYPPIPQSWAKRTESELSDTTNKHWYSHTKSSLYDSAGQTIGFSNPEAFYNDTEHDATVYVPEDSVSYTIDYKKFGLAKEDIAEGFIFQNEGMNIMDPQIQQSIFQLKDMGLSSEEVIELWRTNADFKNKENMAKIKYCLQNSKNKDDLFKLDFIKSDNVYHYNLHDRSCAIQPTAPLLYATAAKIKRDNLDEKQADKLRKDIGLYNIYDEKNYGEINKEFYATYKKTVMANFKVALLEDAKKIMQDPINAVKELKTNTQGALKWASTKTLRWAFEAKDIAYARIQSHTNFVKSALVQKIKEDATKFKRALANLNLSGLIRKYIPTRQSDNSSRQNQPSKATTEPVRHDNTIMSYLRKKLNAKE